MEVLATLRGRFLLSLNDRPEVRALFGGFHIRGIETTYTVSTAPAARISEVLISNHPLPLEPR